MRSSINNQCLIIQLTFRSFFFNSQLSQSRRDKDARDHILKHAPDTMDDLNIMWHLTNRVSNKQLAV